MSTHWFFDPEFWDPKWAWAKVAPDERPMGSWEAMLSGSAAYLVLISVLSFFMRHRRNNKTKDGKPDPQPFNVSTVSLIQNFLMTIYSAYAFWGTFLVVYRNWKANGFDPWIPFCDPKGKMDVGMDWWLYSFYLSKFFEFTDTVLLILRAKPVFPPGNSQYFLHVFHHLVTASIVWITWRVPFSVGWIGPLSNGFVHTFMYAYYFLTELGMNRKYGGILITPIQLIQFILALLGSLPDGIWFNECGTTLWAISWMWFTYGVFLLFFLKLFFDKKAERSAGSTRNGGGSTRNAAPTDSKKKKQ
jgi:hypothetical protein